MRTCLVLFCALLLAGCATPFVGHVHGEGSQSVHFDGRFLATSGTGSLTVGITDKAGAYVYPPGQPLRLDGTWRKGYDVRAKKEITYEAAMLAQGLDADHDTPTVQRVRLRRGDREVVAFVVGDDAVAALTDQ